MRILESGFLILVCVLSIFSVATTEAVSKPSPSNEQSYMAKYGSHSFMKGKSPQERYELLYRWFPSLLGQSDSNLKKIFGDGSECIVSDKEGKYIIRIYRIEVKKYDERTGTSEVTSVDFTIRDNKIVSFEFYNFAGNVGRDIVH